MIDVKEAQVRLIFAEIEERRRKQNAARRAARWRLGLSVAWIVVVAWMTVFLRMSHLDISASDIAGWFFIYAASSAWSEYHARGELHELRAELDQLREEIGKKT